MVVMERTDLRDILGVIFSTHEGVRVRQLRRRMNDYFASCQDNEFMARYLSTHPAYRNCKHFDEEFSHLIAGGGIEVYSHGTHQVNSFWINKAVESARRNLTKEEFDYFTSVGNEIFSDFN
jgi:hypothetical protein